MENIVLSEIAMDLIINIINIVLLFVIVRTLVYKPVKKFLDERTARIKSQIDEAEALKEKNKKTVQQRDEIIAAATREAAEIKSAAENSARENAAAITERAEKAAEEALKKAKIESENEREKMLTSAREDIAALSVKIAEKVLEREVTNADTKKIADDFFGSEA